MIAVNGCGPTCIAMVYAGITKDTAMTPADIAEYCSNNNYYNERGTCLGAKTQLAILSDGTVSICCLDSEGVSNLGNIYLSTMEDILASDKYQNILKGFNDNKVYLDICKHCSYKERFDKK